MGEARKSDRLRPDRRNELPGRFRGTREEASRTTWDTALTRALDEVPVPAGLAERLLARLGASDRAEAPAASRLTRRSWWTTTAAAAVACAAGVALTVVWFGRPVDSEGPESIAQLARSWHNATERFEIERGPGPQAYPLGSYVLPGFVEGWHRLPRGFFARDGVAYQMLTAAGQHATLYVVDLAGSRLAPRLLVNATTPTENLLSTDGQTSSSWTDGQRLYVLVVDGGEGALRSLVRASRSMA